MSTPSFSLNQKQIDILEESKRYLLDSEINDWYRSQQNEANNFHELLRSADFPDNDLSEIDFDQLFREMRAIVNNRALARNLYEVNGIEKFNTSIRELLFGTSSLVDRIDQFLDLQGVGKATVSHFLYVHRPTEYPVATQQMEGVVEIQPSQRKEAENIASSIYQITDRTRYHSRTIEYLGDIIIYSKVKEILGVPDYFMVNNVLWYEYLRKTEGVEPDVPLSSISIEADLRSYLAKNPHLLGQNLTVIKEEYDTKEVGRMDILLEDGEGRYLVVETKKGRTSDRVVGQILRYMGWVQKNLGENVKGLIILAEPDHKLDYALIPIPKINVNYYKVKFELSEFPS